MKKFLFLLLATALMVGAKAQVIFPKSRTVFANTNPTADTLTNVDTIYNIVRAGGLYNASIQVDVTTLSGTLAGHAYLSGSINGINYVPLDTVTLSGAISSSIYQFNPSPYQYYKVAFITSGTSVSIPVTYGLFRQVAY
jgi:hypothetical protein